jgi:hypothetical protein
VARDVQPDVEDSDFDRCATPRLRRSVVVTAAPDHHQEPEMNSYHHETIARQRLDEAARAARTAYMFEQGAATRPRRWSFPKVTFPSRQRPRLTPRPV